MTEKLELELKNAMAFAQKAHAAQMYGGCYPYFKHLENVYKILVEFGYSHDNPEDHPILIAAYLHDIIEDTATSYSDVKKEFGLEIAEIVFCMTDEMGRNRKEKKEKTYPKIRSNPKSIILKLADRIANINFSISAQQTSFIEMYRKEFPEFQYNLRIYKHVDNMWDRLAQILKA